MPLLPIEEAASLLCRRAEPISRREFLPLRQALGRVAAAGAAALLGHPPFDRSLLDGYALRRADLAGASRETPVRLPVSHTYFAGDPPGGPLPPGQAVRVMTGAPVPAGADCVLRQEDTDMGEESVCVFTAPPLFSGIRRQGADLPVGAPLLSAGTVLAPVHIGALTEQGLSEVEAFARPRVGLLASGDELVPPGLPISPGKIGSGNLYYLEARLTQLGLEPVVSGVHADEPEHLAQALSVLLAECDAVITTGGTGEGQRDHMPRVCRLLGGVELFRGVAAKPGNHTLAAVISGKPVVFLPGTPAAAAVMLELLARPMLLKLAGRRNFIPRRVPGVLTEPLCKAYSTRRLVWVRQEGGAVSLPNSPAEANGLMDIPANSPALPAGTQVEVIPL